MLYNALHRIQFQKNLMYRFRENFNNVDSGPKKCAIYPILGKEFHLNIQNTHLKPLFNKSHQVQFQKNPINRFREKLQCVDVGSKK